ncbi:hypothetical protein EBZ38_06465 [bacterium]|nr:hypothetical protein [bacterium]
MRNKPTMAIEYTELELIYWEGLEAGEAGIPFDENPYEMGTENYVTWLEGWDAGEERLNQLRGFIGTWMK